MNSNSLVLAYPEKFNMFFLFLNQNNELSNIVKDSYSFLDSESSETEDVLIQFSLLISKIKELSPQYVLTDSFMFNVDMDDTINDTDLLQFIDEDVTLIMNRHFKPLPFLNDIIISPSLPIFHNVNALFFILKEKPKTAILPKLVFSSEESSAATDADAADDVSMPIFHKTRKHFPNAKRHTHKRHN